MKKLVIPAILLFWLVVIMVGVAFMNRPHDPPPPPPRDLPANVEVTVSGDGHQLVRLHTRTGDVVEFAGSDGSMVDYQGPVYGTPYHLIYRSESEGDDYTDLVHEGSGKFVTLTGPAIATDDGRWVASAGSNGIIGYSAVDIVELLDSGPEVRFGLNAYHQGLWVDGVQWTKSGQLLVNATRGYVTFCDAPDAELMVGRDESGEWTAWLNAARSVSVAEGGRVRIRGDMERTVQGRFVGEIANPELGTLYLLDPAFELIDDAAGPANPETLVLNTGDDEWEIGGWPIFAPSGLRLANSSLPCDPVARAPRTIRIDEWDEGYWASSVAFDPRELGWSSSRVTWTNEDEFAVLGWIPGGARLVDGLIWQHTTTGVFVFPEQSAAEASGITGRLDGFSLALNSGGAIDFPNTAVPEGLFRYLGFAEAMDAHLLRIGTGDTGTFLVVSDATGELWTVPGVPIPDPSGEWFATTRLDADRRQYEVSVFPWPPTEDMVPVWEGTALVEDLENVSWDSDRYLSLGDDDAVQLNLESDGIYRWSRGVG